MSERALRLEGVSCSMTIDEPAPGVVLVTIEGTDTGELGDAPFRALAPRIASGSRVEMFIDARAARGASIEVSDAWAQWPARHADALRHASMLTASRLVRLTAELVQRFYELGDVMRIYTEPARFEGALSNAIANARRP